MVPGIHFHGKLVGVKQTPTMLYICIFYYYYFALMWVSDKLGVHINIASTEHQWGGADLG